MRILDEIKAEFGSFAAARQAALSGKASDLERVIAFLLKDEEWQRHNIRHNEIVRLQKGHMDPSKPLEAGNIIPQCQVCNRAGQIDLR